MQDFNQLARDLCHVEKSKRDASLERVKTLVEKLETLQDYKKCWKALFYCFWMSDKMLIQQELAEKLSLMMNEKFYYLAGFWDIIAKEWHGIDRIRLNKFYYLIRTMHKATFNWMKASNWDPIVISKILKVMVDGPLNANDSKVPDGLRYHTIEVFFTILHQVEPNSKALSLSTFEVLFSPFLSLLRNTSNLNIVSHILEDILDLYTKPDSELGKWINAICPAKDISSWISGSLGKFPSKNKKAVQEYLTKWGKDVGIPFVNQVVVTGMDVKTIYNNITEVTMKRDSSGTSNLEKPKKQKLEKLQNRNESDQESVKKKKGVAPRKVKNDNSEDISGGPSKIPIAVSNSTDPDFAPIFGKIRSNSQKMKSLKLPVNSISPEINTDSLETARSINSHGDSKKTTVIRKMEAKTSPHAVKKTATSVEVVEVDPGEMKKSLLKGQKQDFIVESELKESLKASHSSNGEVKTIGQGQKSPKKEKASKNSLGLFQTLDVTAESSGEASKSARSRNLARTIPADTIALLRNSLKSKKPKKKNAKKSQVELQVEKFLAESGFQSDILEPVSSKKAKAIEELQQTQSSPIPKKSVSWGPSNIKAFKKHETICSNEQAQQSPVITSTAPTILKSFEKPLIQEFTEPAKKSKRVAARKKKGGRK